MRQAISVLILLLAPVALFSQSQTSQAEKFQTGKVLAVVEYPEGRVFDWVNHGAAPIYDGYAFYDINVQVDNKCYVVRYESHTGYYPCPVVKLKPVSRADGCIFNAMTAPRCQPAS